MEHFPIDPEKMMHGNCFNKMWENVGIVFVSKLNQNVN